jgi:hypothetical protein
MYFAKHFARLKIPALDKKAVRQIFALGGFVAQW